MEELKPVRVRAYMRAKPGEVEKTVHVRKHRRGWPHSAYPYESDTDAEARVVMTGATLSGNTLTLDTAEAANVLGKQVAVYYQYMSEPDKTTTIVVETNKFAKAYRLVGDALFRSRDGVDHKAQVVMPNLQWTSNLTFDLSAEGDPASTSFECEIMRDKNTATMVEVTILE